MTFPRARKGRAGYAIDEVDEFLERARRAYTATDASETAGDSLTADDIRVTAFSMVRRDGYSAKHVDAALERLEDAFSSRERERGIAEIGEQAWFAEARLTAQSILDRAARPAGKRFQRVSLLTVGYSVRDVDAFADQVAQYFQAGASLSVDDVRSVAFRPQRGGYREAQVDLVLDAVVRVMLAVR